MLKTQSHGHWQIKGVADPIELFEVGFPEDRFVAPSDSEKVFRVVKTGDWWMPVKDIPNNLPHQGTSFVGREREIDEVKDMLAQARLVTLLGMGGLGKTRLSLQVAAEQLALFPDGVWFLDLSPLTDGTLGGGRSRARAGRGRRAGPADAGHAGCASDARSARC